MSKKWPIDFVAFRAKQGSILSWKYGTTEAHPLLVNDWELADLRTQTMPDFIETAVNTWRPQVVWLSVSMPKHAKKTHPASVVTLMVSFHFPLLSPFYLASLTCACLSLL